MRMDKDKEMVEFRDRLVKETGGWTCHYPECKGIDFGSYEGLDRHFGVHAWKQNGVLVLWCFVIGLLLVPVVLYLESKGIYIMPKL